MGAEEVTVIMMITMMSMMIMLGKDVEEVMLEKMHRMHDLNPYLRCMHPVCKCGDSHFTR